MAETTFYRWRKKYGGMGVSDARRLKHLEDENRRPKRIVADQALTVVSNSIVRQSVSCAVIGAPHSSDRRAAITRIVKAKRA